MLINLVFTTSVPNCLGFKPFMIQLEIIFFKYFFEFYTLRPEKIVLPPSVTKYKIDIDFIKSISDIFKFKIEVIHLTFENKKSFN